MNENVLKAFMTIAIFIANVWFWLPGSRKVLFIKSSCGKFIKIIILLIATFISIGFLIYLWNSQIDPRQTIDEYINEKVKNQVLLAVRDENKIYKNGKVVGNVTGKIDLFENELLFRKISNANFIKGDLIEYKRDKCRITQFDSYGLYISKDGTSEPNLKENVICVFE